MHSNSLSPDSSQRFIFENSDVRGELVKLNRSYIDTIQGKHYPDAVAVLLGQFLAASVLLSTTIKFDGRLVLQVRSKGQVALIMAEATSGGEVRGIARYAETPTSHQFSELLHDGTLVITIDRKKGEPYQGIVALEGNSLAECLQEYFRQSEQLASLFFFAADRDGVAGLMLQQLPMQEQKDPELRAGQWDHYATLARTLTDDELLGLPNAEILHRLYHQEELRLFAPRGVVFKCSCSRERTARALFSLGREEIDDMIAERGGVEISCEFCGTEYNFGPGELALLFERSADDSAH